MHKRVISGSQEYHVVLVEVSEDVVAEYQIDLLPVLGDHRLLVQVDMHLFHIVAVMELIEDGLFACAGQPTSVACGLFLVVLSALLQLVAVCLQMLLFVLLEQFFDDFSE